MKFKLDDLDDVFNVISRFTGYSDILIGLVQGGAALAGVIRDAIRATPEGEMSLDEIRILVTDYLSRQDGFDKRYADPEVE